MPTRKWIDEQLISAGRGEAVVPGTPEYEASQCLINLIEERDIRAYLLSRGDSAAKIAYLIEQQEIENETKERGISFS